MENAVNGQSIEVLTFNLHDEAFAVKAGHVREILDLIPISEVPGAPPFMNGLINVRGKVVPLADPKLRLGLEPNEATVDTRIIVVEVDGDGQDEIVGLLADKVNEVAVVPTDLIEKSPKIGVKWNPEFVLGIGKIENGFIHILDLAKIIEAEF